MKTVATLITLLGAGLLSACNSEPAVPKPEQTVQQLMATGVQPTAEIYWDAVRYISDINGNHDYFPRNDAEWEKTRLAAVKITEYGELLAKPEYANGRGEDWLTFANALVEVGKKAQQTAVDKDVNAVFEIGGVVYRVCSACHLSYPAENLPKENPPAV